VKVDTESVHKHAYKSDMKYELHYEAVDWLGFLDYVNLGCWVRLRYFHFFSLAPTLEHRADFSVS
jgi:hypothetical protein